MDSVEIIRSLASTKSRQDKDRIIRDAFLDGSHEFFVGARLALDPFTTFGLTKVAEILEDDLAPGDLSFSEFVDLADRIRQGLTDSAARAAIYEAAMRCNVSKWNLFYRRILLKDLKVGVDAKQINKMLRTATSFAATDYLIPVFGCQLVSGAAPKLCGQKLIDVKVAGLRVLTIINKESETVTFYGQTGRIIVQFPEVHAATQRLLGRLPGSIVLDGVFVSPQGSRHALSASDSGYHADMAQVRYAMFDIIPLRDFRIGHCGKRQTERHHLLEMMQESGLWLETDGRLHVIPQIAIDFDTEDGRAAYDEFTQRARDDGYQGVMIKDPDAAYVCKRTTAWLYQQIIDVSITP